MAKKISDEDVLDALQGVFQRHGYAGTSMSLIAEASGLGRASLYHRFPGGKLEIALAVLEGAAAWVEEHVLTPLRSAAPPRERVAEMGRQISMLYEGGRRSCLLDALALGDSETVLRDRVQEATEAWADALARTLRDAGLAPDEARVRAEDGLVAIQGSLVLARALRDQGPFLRTVASMEDRLFGGIAGR